MQIWACSGPQATLWGQSELKHKWESIYALNAIQLPCFYFEKVALPLNLNRNNVHSVFQFLMKKMLFIVCVCPFIHPQRYPAEVTDLISEGEIGSGTCGQVFKVRFKKTGHVIAVKVRPLFSPYSGSWWFPKCVFCSVYPLHINWHSSTQEEIVAASAFCRALIVCSLPTEWQ